MEVLRESIDFFRNTFFILLGSLMGSFFAGIVLGGAGMRSLMEKIPGLLLIIPAFLATRGNVYGAMGAKISTALHQGLIRPEFEYNQRLVNAMVSGLINGMIASGFIGIAGWSLLAILGLETAPFLVFVSILLVSGLLSAIILGGLLVVLLFTGYRVMGMDPDVLNGPLITSLGDFFGMFILYFSVMVVGWIIGV